MTVMTGGIGGRGVVPRVPRRDHHARAAVLLAAIVAIFLLTLALAAFAVPLAALVGAALPPLAEAIRAQLGGVGRLAGTVWVVVIVLPPAALIAGPSLLERVRERRAGR